MIPLPNNFSFDGFKFRLIKRCGDVALFDQRRPNHLQGHFEVVIVQRRPAETINGRHYPDREIMPRPEGWGQMGWTFMDLPSALQKFDQLVRNRFHPTPFLVEAFSGHERLGTADPNQNVPDVEQVGCLP